jgi:hypothetical protein
VKRAIVALIGIIVVLVAGIFAVAALGLLLVSHRSGAQTAARTDAVLACTVISVLLLFLAIGLFRFRRWALITTIVSAGLCSVYSIARLLVMKPGTNAIGSWCFLLSGMGIALFLASVTAKQTSPPIPQGSRPVGVTAMAILGFTYLPVGVLTISKEIRIHAPEWQVASAVFNTLLCAALWFGLWKLREWARILTEVTGFQGSSWCLAITSGAEEPQSHPPYHRVRSVGLCGLDNLVPEETRGRAGVYQGRISNDLSHGPRSPNRHA